MLYGGGGRGHILRPRPLSGNPARGDSMIGALAGIANSTASCSLRL
jgi:hypothetical protein